jgi:hypothetical protein
MFRASELGLQQEGPSLIVRQFRFFGFEGSRDFLSRASFLFCALDYDLRLWWDAVVFLP